MCETESRMACDLRHIPLFEGLETQVVERIARTSCRREVRKGERIYWQGETARAFYYVVSGHVRRAVASPEGEEKVIDIVSPGRYFALVELFGTSPYTSFAEAVDTVILLRVGKEGLLGAVADSRFLALRLLEATAEQQATLEREVAATFCQSGSRRLVDYLLREAGPALRAEGDTILELPISKRLVAARIGITAETLSRAFRELSDADLIAVRGRRIVLREKLALRHARKMDGDRADLPHQQLGRRHGDQWGDRARFSGARASQVLM